MTPPPLPAGGARWALFLDFDGTLAEFAEHPDEVRIDPGLPDLLAGLARGLDGALAVVSGRRIDSLDRLLHPAAPPAAGLHGLERRSRQRTTTADEHADLSPVRRALEAFVAGNPGVLLEDKGGALALHYRNAPALEHACREYAAALAQHLPLHHVLAGKMVFEIKPRGAHKGNAIAAFMGEAPFQGRTPVFAGDDRTDEDGFRWINDNGGISIKVGEGTTQARHRLADVPALHRWLQRLHGTIEGGHGT